MCIILTKEKNTHNTGGKMPAVNDPTQCLSESVKFLSGEA